MTTKKTFKPGDLLTAADVNQYLVNDDDTSTVIESSLTSSLNTLENSVTALEESLKDILIGGENLKAFIIDKSTYSGYSSHNAAKTGHAQFLAARFPSNVKIISVLHHNLFYPSSDVDWDSSYWKNQGNVITNYDGGSRDNLASLVIYKEV